MDDIFPKPKDSNALRALLRQIGDGEEELVNSPVYKSGYEDGFVMGRMEAEEETKCLVRALIKLYDSQGC